MSGRRYLTLKEFSTHAGHSEATIRRLRKRGLLPVVQPGGPRTKLLFRADALEQVGGGTMRTTPAAARGWS